jgi:hypothetical protein
MRGEVAVSGGVPQKYAGDRLGNGVDEQSLPAGFLGGMRYNAVLELGLVQGYWGRGLSALTKQPRRLYAYFH